MLFGYLNKKLRFEAYIKLGLLNDENRGRFVRPRGIEELVNKIQ